MTNFLLNKEGIIMLHLLIIIFLKFLFLRKKKYLKKSSNACIKLKGEDYLFLPRRPHAEAFHDQTIFSMKELGPLNQIDR